MPCLSVHSLLLSRFSPRSFQLLAVLLLLIWLFLGFFPYFTLPPSLPALAAIPPPATSSKGWVCGVGCGRGER